MQVVADAQRRATWPHCIRFDKLDDLVQNANAVHFTGQVRIDNEEIFDILDEMRGALGRARTR
jgi:hypothetical protein